MPLAFPSLSHGTVAFGFFNIETHMLLLEQLFFFADTFCEAAVTIAGAERASLPGWRIEPARVGNLHGAIAGVDLSGFIGATYRLFPFPARPEDFRQAPDGHRNAAVIEELIGGFGTPETIALLREPDAVRVGELGFSRTGFTALLDYVVRGGYPRWRDDLRPAYVQRMVERLATDDSPFSLGSLG
jgi:hypothetical protein